MAKHEPGPWRLGGCSGRIVKKSGYGDIADVDTLANATLIAAAPEMYAALIAIKQRIHFVGMPQEKRREDGRPDWSKEIRLAEKAIAKAERGAS